MEKLIFCIVYLIGCYYSYKLAKINLTRDMQVKVWTEGNRNIAFLFASISWLGWIANFITYIKSVENTKHSKFIKQIKMKTLEENLLNLLYVAQKRHIDYIDKLQNVMMEPDDLLYYKGLFTANRGIMCDLKELFVRHGINFNQSYVDILEYDDLIVNLD